MITETNEHRQPYIDVPEAVGVFDSFEAMKAAIYDLRMYGFGRRDISLLGGKEAIQEKLGSAYWHSSELEDNPDVPRAPFISEDAIGALEKAIAGGFFCVGSIIAMVAIMTPVTTLETQIAAIALGGGPAAMVGTLLARRIGQQHRDYFADQIRKGGIVVWVRTPDKEKECLAVKILRGHSGRDVHVHIWGRS